MTKAELIERIARSRDLPPDISKKLIGQILGIAFDELASYFARARVTRSQSPRFTFPHFGTFTKKRRSARRGVNPRTLEPIQIEACNTIDFKASRELREAMNPTLRAGDGTELSEAPWMSSVADAPDGVGASPQVEAQVGVPAASAASKTTASGAGKTTASAEGKTAASAEGKTAAPAAGKTAPKNPKKKVKGRSKPKATRGRDGAIPRVVAVGPGKRRLTPRDDELDAFDDAGSLVPPESSVELPASPMQRVTGRRRTRSRGTG